MLPGFGGRLVSEEFLEQITADDAERPADWVALHACRSKRRTLGPASSLRAMLEDGAEPLARALAYDRAEQVRIGERSATAALRTGTSTVGLYVASWGERMNPLWRPAVLHAVECGAEWC